MPPPTEIPDAPAARDATTRRRAVALAGHQDDYETARRGLDDPAATVRATALGALSRLGRLDIDDLSSAMGDDAAEVRARAAELAVALAATAGDDAVALVEGALSDHDARVVEAACFALGEIGAGANSAVSKLAEVGTGHPDPICREAAVAALGAIGDPAGLAAILEATSDKPAVRRRAVLALAPFSGPDVDAALQRALDDRDWQVRQAAEDLTGTR